MPKRITIALIAAALGLGLALLAGCGKRTSSGESNVIATVNGKDITRAQLCDVLEDQDVSTGGRGLDNVISEQLIRQEAEKRGIKVTAQELDARVNAVKDDVLATTDKSWDDYVKQSGQTEASLRDAMSFQALAAKLTLPDEDRQRFFEQYKTQLQKSIPSANEVAVYRRIVLGTQPEAEAVRKDLLAKPGDFGKVADAKSMDPMGRGHGGLAVAMKGQLQPPDPALEKLLFSLKPGEISEPLPVAAPAQPNAPKGQKPPEQWQIVQVVRVTQPRKPFTLENYAPEIEQLMMRQPQYQSQVQQFVEQLQAKANIQIVSPRYKPMEEMYKQRQQAYQQMQGAPQGMPGMPGAGTPSGPGAAPAGRAPSGRAPQGAAAPAGRAPHGK